MVLLVLLFTDEAVEEVVDVDERDEEEEADECFSFSFSLPFSLSRCGEERRKGDRERCRRVVVPFSCEVGSG